MKIKAVCFDIDGTLYPNYRMYTLMLPTFLMHPRLSIAYSKARKKMRQISFADYEGMSFRQIQATVVKEFYRTALSVEELEKKIENDLYRSWEHAFKRVRAYDRVRETMDVLKSQGILLGVLSDFPVQHKLRYLQLPRDFFAHISSSEEAGALKPDEKAFLPLIEAFECDPSEILYVGNSYEKDVLGARKMGFLTAHLVRKKPKETVANFSFANFEEFIKKIKILMI